MQAAVVGRAPKSAFLVRERDKDEGSVQRPFGERAGHFDEARDPGCVVRCPDPLELAVVVSTDHGPLTGPTGARELSHDIRGGDDFIVRIVHHADPPARHPNMLHQALRVAALDGDPGNG